MKSNERIPVILDTDIGSDIDDAVCLAYLLRQPACELVGVTAVTGREPRERAALASAVCRAAGRNDIPIHSGASCGITTGGVVTPNVTQAVVLDRFDHRPIRDFPTNTAVQFLWETINARPGEITLLAIGPMTNIGLLFALDPDIPRKLKRLVLMCGHFDARPFPWRGQRYTEYNALHDPFATHIVYRTPVADHLSVGLDVTTQVTMPTDECITRFKNAGGPLAVVSAMTEVWGDYAPHVTFHDPLAATLIFKPEICAYQQGQVTVELASTRYAGLTFFERKETGGPHKVAWDVNPQMFFDEYFGVVGKS